MRTTMPRGLPRPICPTLRKPVPFNVELHDDGDAHFSCTNQHRVELTEHYRLCQVCGKRLYKNAVFFLDGEVGTVIDMAGLHRRCARLALAHCPFLQDPKDGKWNDPHSGVVAIYAPVEQVMTVDESEDRLQFPTWKDAPAYMKRTVDAPEFRSDLMKGDVL